jgi:hypothetical protein
VYLVCRLLKRDGRYAIGSQSFSTGNLTDAMTHARRMAQSARWRRIIPPSEIDAAGTALIRAWETRGGGIAVVTTDPARIPARAASPIGFASP